MIRVELFCTSCNASAQRRDPGDEVSTGYAVMEFTDADRFYLDAVDAQAGSVKRPWGWTHDQAGRLICDACGGHSRPSSARAVNRSRVEPLRQARWLTLPRGDGWPAHSSPFTDD